MKNLKNIAAAATLTAILMVGATPTKAGLLMSDRAAGVEQCTTGDDTSLVGMLVSDLAGFLLSDRAGLLMSDSAGLLMSDSAEVKPCEEMTLSGILVSD